MATIRWFQTNTIVSVHQEMSETSPGAEQTSSPNVGWTVAKIAAGNYSEFNSGVEQTSGTFSTTVRPDGSINTTIGDCLRTTNTYNGTFAAGLWNARLRVRAVSSGGDADGNAGYQLFRSVNADGSGATEITAGRLEGATVTNLTTTASQDSNVDISLGAVTVTDEYLFLQIGWEITGAGGANSRDVITRIGTLSSGLLSTDFTPAVVEGHPTMRRWGGVPGMPLTGRGNW